MRKFSQVLLFVILPTFVFAQNTVSGTVSDASTGDALPGANVVLEGTSMGAAASSDGTYSISNVPAGSYTVTASVIGYANTSKTVNVSGDVTVNFSLTISIINVSAIDVVAARASTRKTPAAFTDVTGEEIELRLASRDLTMALNETPGVYASMTGGGSGDSRVVVRGFDQRNTAVLINGVPVNDMENGWVYWSNWDGISDVTNSIQVQRGLGTSLLTKSSIGGAINVLTSAADASPGTKFKSEIGQNGFFKNTLSHSTGRMDNGFALTALLQKKSGLGWVDGTWTDAYSYFLTLSKPMGDHIFDFTLLGAPQQHGQRDGDNKWSQTEWSDFNDFTGYSQDDYRATNKGYSGSGWGYITDADYKLLTRGNNSLDGIGNMLFGGIQETKKVGGKYLINNRTNYYHKPVYNLNWLWKIDNVTKLSTVLYGSNGRGGGTGPLNSRGTFLKPDKSGSKYYKYINPSHNADGTYNWSDLIAWNRSDWDTNSGNGVGDPNYDPQGYRSKAIIRASVNHHNWYGAISTVERNINDNLKFTGGVDWRYYKGVHYREVINLLGGDYYAGYADKNWKTNADKVRKVGDKVAYHNDGINQWTGFFSQAEYSTDNLSVVASGAFNNTTYQRIDYFNYTKESGDQESEKVTYPGSAFKLGANYNVNDALNIYGNFGSLSIAPDFRNAYLNYKNDVNKDAKNESVTAMEFGIGYATSQYGVNANFYNTTWDNKSYVRSSGDEIFNIQGISANHSGFEVDGKFIVNSTFSLKAGLSLGDWKWGKDVVAKVQSDMNREETYDVKIYTDGLYVGNAPQTQYYVGGTIKPIPGLTVSPVIKMFDKHYADFDPTRRNDINDREQSAMMSGFNSIDIHGNYNFALSGYNLALGIHLLNAGDSAYVADAKDGSSHKPEDADVFYGLGRRFLTTLSIRF